MRTLFLIIISLILFNHSIYTQEETQKNEEKKSTETVKKQITKSKSPSKKSVKKTSKKDKYIFEKVDENKYKFDRQGNPIKEEKKSKKKGTKSTDYLNKTEATKPFSIYKFDEAGNPITPEKKKKKEEKVKDELKIGNENLKITVNEDKK